MGYSGFGQWKNDPTAQAFECKGPIPRGYWTVVNLIAWTPYHGPYVLVLMANKGTILFGRDGFLCHGDSITDPGTASEGCIIQARSIREAWWQSGDRDLEVIA
jgi:Protein of unknown function (DUF2778)